MTSKDQEESVTDALPEFFDNPDAHLEAAVEATAADPAAAAEAPAEDAGPPPTSGDDGPRATADRAGPPPAGGSLATGAVLLALGIAADLGRGLGLLPAAAAPYAGVGTVLLVLGGALLGAALVRRRLGAATAHLDSVLARHEELQERLQTGLDFLVEHQRAQTEKPPAEGEELERVLLALQRQDEKVNNLTRAIKMYGKPLMEISGQVADAAGAVSQLRQQHDTAAKAQQATGERLAAAIQAIAGAQQTGSGANRKEIEELLQRAFAALDHKLPRSEALQQQLTRVEAVVQALGARLDDSEVRRSLLRLEDASKTAMAKVDKLAQTDSLQAGVDKLDQHLADSVTRLASGLEQMKQGQLGTLEGSVRDIQREIAGLATSVSQISAVVKGGAMRAPAPTPGPAPTPVPAPTAGQGPAAGPTPAPTAAAPSPAAPVDDAHAGAQQNQVGTRASSGRNVLGAIAKLKQMKK